MSIMTTPDRKSKPIKVPGAPLRLRSQGLVYNINGIRLNFDQFYNQAPTTPTTSQRFKNAPNAPFKVRKLTEDANFDLLSPPIPFRYTFTSLSD
jgi:hypothetical protein